MRPSLRIDKVCLSPGESGGTVFDMTRRCAFAICTLGDFTIKILNVQYNVKARWGFACMPFVNIDVVEVAEASEIIFGSIRIEDVPGMINRWVNSDNLSAIQNCPLVKIPDTQFCRLIASIKNYSREIGETISGDTDNSCVQIQRDIIDFQSRLIVAQVLKLYFSSIHMEAGGHTHRDEIFQQFMLTLYSNFREHRNVSFYATRSGVSQKYFSTVIRQLSGTSPSEWIERVVAGEAKSMLSDINRSIKDIAATLNFPDAPTFTKYFRRVTGMTPKYYRKLEVTAKDI